MGPTIKELEDNRKHWEDQLIDLARRPRPSQMAIYYAMEKVRDAHAALEELKAEMRASKDKLAKHGIMFG